MLYKRIKKNADFQKLFKKGKRVFSPCLTVLYFPSRTLSMGVAVSKKHGKAVVRNRIKRLVRAAFTNTASKLSDSYNLIIIPKTDIEYNYKAFEESLAVCFKKINLCAKN